jgi:hypothetical protein
MGLSGFDVHGNHKWDGDSLNGRLSIGMMCFRSSFASVTVQFDYNHVFNPIRAHIHSCDHRVPECDEEHYFQHPVFGVSISGSIALSYYVSPPKFVSSSSKTGCGHSSVKLA